MWVLRIVGAVYVLSSLWCMFQPELSSKALGFEFTHKAALTEYFSVYGGLQLGLGLAMLFSSYKDKLLIGAVFFSCVFSFVLCLSRIVGIIIHSSNELMWILFILELVIACLLFWQWRQFDSV